MNTSNADTQTQAQKQERKDRNEDPITGEPGAHPVGTGVGAASGGAIGAGIGAIGGPIGVAVGAALGAVAGGLAGKGVAEVIDPTVERAYWSENYKNESYVPTESTFEDYEPAYRSGYETWVSGKYPDYETAEADLEKEWPLKKGNSNLNWENAKHASRAAWDRVQKNSSSEGARDRQ